MTTELRDLEPRQAMQQFLKFSGSYCGQINTKSRRATPDKIWASSLNINLAAMDTHNNTDRIPTLIKDDDDAADRVIYTLNHEWMHYAFYKISEDDSMAQERMIYASIGNGGNNYFNEFYNIAKDPALEARVANHE